MTEKYMKLSTNVKKILSNFSSIKPGFFIDSKQIKTIADDEAILAFYDVLDSDGLQDFNNVPLSNVDSFVDEINDLSEYDVAINEHSLDITGVTSSGLSISASQVYGAPEYCASPSTKLESTFDNDMISLGSLSIDQSLLTLLKKKSAKSGNDLVQIIEEDGEIFITLSNPEIDFYTLKIKVDSHSIKPGSLDGQHVFSFKILSLLIDSKDGYEVTLKLLETDVDGSGVVYPFSKFEAKSFDNLRYYVSSWRG
jgi:hypothetical protein